jgi:hypothetical protein
MPLSPRITYISATASAILLGLASRRWPAFFPAMLGKYPGDALWAMMVFFALRAMMPSTRIRTHALLALGIAYAVEFGQLYQAGWINAIRATTLGHLVLGQWFGWMDLCAYAIGIGLGVAFAIFAVPSPRKP